MYTTLLPNRAGWDKLSAGERSIFGQKGAQKELLPQGPCSGCGKSGVVGAQHNKPKAVTGGKAEMCGRYQASEPDDVAEDVAK